MFLLRFKFRGFAQAACKYLCLDPGGVTYSSQGVAVTMSPGEIGAETPGKSDPVLSPRLLNSLVELHRARRATPAVTAASVN